MEIIAYIYTDFHEKFGIPRQAGLAPSAGGRIIFEPKFRSPDSIRGLEEFSHIWLIWEFSKNTFKGLTVKPPKLGGKEKKGVFATRSPYRPNPIGLSSVKLEKIEMDTELGPVLHVSGVDMLNRTPIFDIKPYVPYADIHMDAGEGFTETTKKRESLRVELPDAILGEFPLEKKAQLSEVLSLDPRPAYDIYEDRVYGVEYAGFNIRFRVEGEVLTVVEIAKVNTTGIEVRG